MKKRILTDAEKKIWYKYHSQGGGNLNRCKVNKINISLPKTNDDSRVHLLHEGKKMKDSFEIYQEGEKFITEAVDNKTGLVRDVVNLTRLGDIIEEETGMRYKRFLNDPDRNKITINHLEKGVWVKYIIRDGEFKKIK